ncbi:MAG: hypothetical protein IJI98_11315 [Methanosphaera sp.]|nr:hypothetical protein [Methanosphaera sp.]
MISNYEEYDENKEYKSILFKISNYNSFKFNKTELEHILNTREEKVLDDFLELNTSHNFFEKKDEEYIVKNELFKMYFETLNLKRISDW